MVSRYLLSHPSCSAAIVVVRSRLSKSICRSIGYVKLVPRLTLDGFAAQEAVKAQAAFADGAAAAELLVEIV